MHVQIRIALGPSLLLGLVSIILFKVLIWHRNNVTKRPNLPGTISGGTRKPNWNESLLLIPDLQKAYFYITHERTTKVPDGRIDSTKCLWNFLLRFILKPTIETLAWSPEWNIILDEKKEMQELKSKLSSPTSSALSEWSSVSSTWFESWRFANIP